MAITSYGYGVTAENTEGAIGSLEWARIASYTGALGTVLDSGVAIEGGFTAVVPSVGDRVVTLGPGAAAGHGVLDISDADWTSPSMSQPSSGSRWHVVGVRRNWTSRLTSLAVLGNGTTLAAALNTLNRLGGMTVDQPLWGCRVDAGQSRVQQVIDLRVWGAGASYTAVSRSVLDYVTHRGVTISIDGVPWTMTYDGGGVQRWRPPSGTLLGIHVGSFYTLPTSGYLGSPWQVWGADNQNLGAVSIPDPGVPYRVEGDVRGRIGNEREGTGTRWDFDFRVDDTTTETIIPRRVATEPSMEMWNFPPSRQTFTGETTFRVRARRIYGSGYGAINSDHQTFIARSYAA